MGIPSQSKLRPVVRTSQGELGARRLGTRLVAEGRTEQGGGAVAPLTSLLNGWISISSETTICESVRRIPQKIDRILGLALGTRRSLSASGVSSRTILDHHRTVSAVLNQAKS